MAISKAEMRGIVLLMLQKNPGYQGFFTDDKVDQAIQESVDYVSSKMFFHGDGWLTQIRYLDTVSGQVSVPIPADFAVIDRVRYLVNNQYLPLTYSNDPRSSEWSPNSGQTQYPSTYRVVGNLIYFNPPIGVGGDKYLMVEGSCFPPEMRAETDPIPQRFHRGLLHYIKYRTASVLVSQIGKTIKEWQDLEVQWFAEMIKTVQGRITTISAVLDFDG